MIDNELLTVREVARACHRSEETVRRWIWSGKLPARKLGNQHFIAAADMPDAKARTPRVGEAKAEHRVESLPLSHPLSDGRGSYDREKAIKWLEDTVRIARRIARKNPPFDVTEAIYDSHTGH